MTLNHLPTYRSELKMKLLLTLLNRSKKLSELTNELEIRETSILHALKDLEELGLSTKSGSMYELTSLGIIEANFFAEYSLASKIIEKYKQFWAIHNVTAIPSHLLLQLKNLNDSKLILADSSELGKVEEVFTQFLLNSKMVRGISPIFHPTFVPVIEQLLKQGASVELILTNAVLTKTLALAHINQLKEDIKLGRLRLFLKEDLKVALTVTDNGFSLGLFHLNGGYDDKMDLVSFSPKAIEWGDWLFRDYLKNSHEVELTDSGWKEIERSSKNA